MIMVKNAATYISPVMSGSGTPSPTNVRTISGQTEASLRYGASVSSYESKTLDWPSIAGTVYAGKIDWNRGKLIATHGIKLGSELSWSYYSTHNVFYTKITGGATPTISSGDHDIVCCSHYQVYPGTSHCIYMSDKMVAIGAAFENSSKYNVVVKDTTYGSDATAFSAAVANVQFVYKLATPIEYDIDDFDLELEDDTAVIWSTSGDTEITYFMDSGKSIVAKLKQSKNRPFSPVTYDAIVRGICHRGFNSVCPENTLPAFKQAKTEGFFFVETDLEQTSDGVFVLLHDDTINRTARNADGTTISSTINIHDIAYEDVLEYDFGVWKDASFAGTTIPTLTEFLTLCRAIGLHPYIELKESAYFTAEQVRMIVDIVNDCGMRGNVTYMSFVASYLTQIKEYDEGARLGLLTNSTVAASDIATAESLLTGVNDVFICAGGLSSGNISLCKGASIPMEYWTTDTESTITGMDAYVSGVISNTLHAGKVLHDDAMGL